MNPDRLRSSQDLSLYKALLKDPLINNLNDHIARRDKEGPQGTRRRLLATSVRISPGMSPALTAMVDDCAKHLDVNIPIELYAYNSAVFNAACVKPEEGRLFVMFSSSLLDAFDENELRFVVGHELGHYIYDHHAIPVGYILNGQTQASPQLALQLTSWSRHAEISADRAGAYCTNNFDHVGRALFKLASGITSNYIQFNLDDFLQQVEEMRIEDELPTVNSSAQDWFLTHPFSPLRVKALEVYHRSELAREGGCSIHDMELGVQNLMGLMEPSYLDAKTDASKAMRNLLFAGMLLIANSDNHISPEEIKLFEDFFGKHKYKEDFDLEKLAKDLPQRAERVCKANSISRRMQLVRDLCSMLRAGGNTNLAGNTLLNDIARRLELPVFFIDQAACTQTMLD